MREFKDQKLRSTRRNSGLPPNQPIASKKTSRKSGQSPAYAEAISPKVFLAQAIAMSGETPSSRHGATSSSSQAAASFGRLISESRLPASAKSERLFVLDASSSMSP